MWYLAPDESHNADGKHVAYLDPQTSAGVQLRRLDPDLYDRLTAMVAGGVRSVAQLEAFGVLPAGSRTFGDVLQFADSAPAAKSARVQRRRTWLDDAMRATEDRSVIFADPDNGLRRSDQSIVVYHHADRSAPVPVQAQRRMADAAEELVIEPIAAVRATRGTTRLFLVVPAPAHRAHLQARLHDLERSHWADELVPYWVADR